MLYYWAIIVGKVYQCRYRFVGTRYGAMCGEVEYENVVNDRTKPYSRSLNWISKGAELA